MANRKWTRAERIILWLAFKLPMKRKSTYARVERAHWWLNGLRGTNQVARSRSAIRSKVRDLEIWDPLTVKIVRSIERVGPAVRTMPGTGHLEHPDESPW